MNKKLDYAKVFIYTSFAVILFGMGAIYSATLVNRERTEQNEAYVRVTNCILSTPPAQRGQNDINHCYEKVEKDFGVKLQRYN